VRKHGSKTRFTVAVDAGVADLLDRMVAGTKTTRSAAVEEAISEWLRRLMEQDRRRLDGVGDEARIAAMMVLTALRFQFPAMQGIPDDELRRRATAALEGR
jgi:predicted transcriptional regulator